MKGTNHETHPLHAPLHLPMLSEKVLVQKNVITGALKRVESNEPKLNVTLGGMGTVRQAKDLPAGYSTVTRGPNAGQIVKTDYDANGKQVVRPITKEEGEALGQVAGDYKWNQDVPREKQVAMIKAVRPRIQKLGEQFNDLNNGDIKKVNQAKNWLANEFGWDKTAAFDSNARTAVLELTRALTGVGAMSDNRVKMEMQNLDKAASPAQFKQLLGNVLKALDTYEAAFQKRGSASPTAAPASKARPGYKIQRNSKTGETREVPI